MPEYAGLAMIEQAVKFDAGCSNCERACEGWVVQIAEKGKLRWETELACNECGIEHDGDWGPAPESIRQRLIAAHGASRVCVSDVVPGGKILKTFRDIFALSIQEAKRAAGDLTTGGWQGTKVETSLITEILGSYDIEARECPLRF
ncbi:hypothetical protein ACFVXC_01380 [Streptomyces sp. NPDC058257]|uniref:hypothetical protein n=1 Tax=Streptomyces sp. NPDC058257 TaxID=3346409 RepID=UPI0036E8119E